MPITKLNIEAFLQLATTCLVIDVRSPSEFTQAHIPHAINLPLFNDEERKIIGTTYKQESRQKAIKYGLKYFGVSMVSMVETVEALLQIHKPNIADEHNKTILLHCWRGGMRSAAVAWLLELYGFKVYTLIGGYKAYRHWVLQQFTTNLNLKIIGGYTGSGKTKLLHYLQKNGATIIDLEALANHKGSAFGGLGKSPQPTQEMFENLLATKIDTIKKESSIVWIENESRRIGNLIIPETFFKTIQSKEIYFLNIPFEERLKHIIEEYGKFTTDNLINTILRIKKRLGGLETKNAINYLLENNVEACFSILLMYYDKWYLKNYDATIYPQKNNITVNCSSINDAINAQNLLNNVTTK